MESKKKLKMFPWMADINLEVYKSCFSEDSQLHEILFQKLYNHVSTETSNILGAEDFKRAEKLWEVLNSYILSFHMRSITFHEEPKVPKKSFIMLLSSFVDLYIFLCRGDPSSAHLENCVSDMYLLTGSHLYSIWDILLHCKLFSKSYSMILLPIMNRVMKQLPEVISSPEDYMKMIVLMRYWKIFCDSKADKREICSFAKKIRPPADLYQWLSVLNIESMLELPEVEEKVAKHFLYRQFPKGFFKKMKELLSKGIADNRPSSTISTDKELSTTCEYSSEADGILNLSGLEDFGRNQFEEPELSEVEENNRKKSKKESKGRVEDFHTDASAEVPSVGFFIDSGSDSVGKSQFKVPEIPNVAVKRKKKCKKKQAENVVNNHASKKLSDGEQADIIMSNASTEIPSGNIFDSSEFSSEGGNQFKETELSNLARKRKKRQKQVKSECTSNSSSSKMLSVEQSNVVRDVFTEIPSGGFFIDTSGLNSERESQFKETELPIIPKKKKKSKKQNQAKTEYISNNSPSIKLSHTKTGITSDTSTKIPPGSFFIGTSGLNSEEESQVEEPQLPNIEIGRKKRSKKKKVKTEVISNSSPSEKQTDMRNAPTEVPSGGLLDTFGFNSEGESQFREPEPPSIVTKRKKSKKQNQIEGVLGIPSKKLSDVEDQTDTMSDNAVYSGNNLHLADEIVAQSRCSELKSPESPTAGKIVKVRKLKCKKSKKDNESLENQFEVETLPEKCSRSEASLGSSIIKDVELGEIPDAELSVETVKRLKKKRKRVVELNSPENEVNEDLPLGNDMLQDEPGSSSPVCSKKAKKSLRKGINVSIKLDDLSSGVSSVVHTEHEMEDLETASGLNNNAYDFEDDLSLERVAGSKKNKKKKAQSPHVYTDESISLLSHQTEGTIDNSFVSKGSEIGDNKCEASSDFSCSQVVSPYDKEKKHKLKKKHIISISEFNDIVVTPKKVLSECGSPISDLDHEENKSPVKGSNPRSLQTEEARKSEVNEHNVSLKRKSSQLECPSEKEGKHKLKKKHIISISEFSDVVVTPKKVLSECGSSISDLDKYHEGNKSFLVEDEHEFSPKCNSSQLVSPHDKQKKHRVKKKHVIRVSGASNIVVTPKKELDECDSLVSDLDNESYVENKFSPMKEPDSFSPGKAGKSEVEEGECGVSSEYDSPQLLSPNDKERKHRLEKKQRVIRVSGASDTVEVTPKKSDDHSFLISIVDGNESCEKSKSFSQDVGQSIHPEVAASVQVSAKKEVKNDTSGCKEDYATPRPSFVPYLHEEKNIPKEDVLGNVKGPYNSFVSEHTSVDTLHGEGGSSRKRKKKPSNESFEDIPSDESFGRKGKNDSFHDSSKSSNDGQSICVENEDNLPCSTADVGYADAECKKRKNDSLHDVNKSLTLIQNEECENISAVSNKIHSDGPKVMKIKEQSPAFCEESEVLSVDTSEIKYSPSVKNILQEKRRESHGVNSDGIEVLNDSIESLDIVHRETDCSFGHDKSSHAASVVMEENAGGEISGDEQKVLSDRFIHGEKSEVEKMGQCDSHSDIKACVVASSIDSICDATDSSDASGDERSISNKFIGTRNKQVQKIEVVSESESSDSSFAREISHEKTSNSSLSALGSLKKSNLGLKCMSPKNQLSVLTSSIELDGSYNGGSKKKDTRSPCRLSYSANTPLKSPKAESCSLSAVHTSTVDSPSLQGTPLKEDNLPPVDPHKGEKLFTDSSSESEFCAPLLSQIKKEPGFSGGNKSVSKKSMGVSLNVEASPEELKLFIDSSSGDESNLPKTPINCEFSSPFAGKVSYEDVEEKSGSIVSDSVKDTCSDVSDIDLLASQKKNGKESFLPVLHEADVTNIQSCGSVSSLNAEASAGQKTVRRESLPFSGNDSVTETTEPCDIKTPTKVAVDWNRKDNSPISPACRMQMSSTKKHFQKSEATDGVCVPQINIRCSPNECLIFKQQMPQSENTVISQSSPGGSQDKQMLSDSVPSNSPDDSSNMFTKDKDDSLLNDVTEGTKSPELTSQPVVIPVTRLSDGSGHKGSGSVDSSYGDSDVSPGNDCREDMKSSSVRKPAIGICEKVLSTHGSGTKGKRSPATNNSVVLLPSDATLTPTKVSPLPSKESPCAKGGHNLRGDKTSAQSPTSPAHCEQNKSPQSKHRDKSLLTSPVSSQTSSAPQSVELHISVAEKEENIAVENHDTTPLRHSSRIKRRLLCSSGERELSADDNSNSSVLETPKVSERLNSNSTPRRHSSRRKQFAFFPGEKLPANKIKKSPSKMCLSESSSMMDVKNHLDFSDLKTSPQSSQASSKNSSPSPKKSESGTVTTKDVNNLDDVKSTKSSPDVEVDLPPSSWKSRLRTPAKFQRENSPASPVSSTNLSETLNDHSSNESETPVWKRPARSGELFASEPKQYSKKKSDGGTVIICQSLRHLCLATPCSTVIHRLPAESSPKRTSNETFLADSVLEDFKSSGTAETASGTDDEAVPSTQSSPVKKDLVKKNPLNDLANSSSKMRTRKSNIIGTTEKHKEELVTSSCSKVRTRKSIFGTSEKDKEGYNLRPRKSFIMPSKLNI